MKKQKTIIAILSLLLFFVLFFGINTRTKTQKENSASAAQYSEKINLKNEKEILIKEEIYSDVPGILAIGDSLTAGAGGEGATYPSILKSKILKNIYDIEVINMGVGGEDTTTIMGRVGSIPYFVERFLIPSNKEEVEINLYSSNGSPVAPLKQGDGYLNPVTINGVEGRITIEQDPSNLDNFLYFFKRNSIGDSVEVSQDTSVLTNAMKYENYIPIVLMGQNGRYNTGAELIEQIESIVYMESMNSKFLVLGLPSGTAEERFLLEEAMADRFNSRYINLRELLVQEGLTIVNIDPTEADIIAIDSGRIPPSLLSDEVHFNSKGYEAIGEIVFNRIEELGFLDNIKVLSEQLNKANYN